MKPRSELIRVRVTPDELAAIERAAESAGLTVAAWVRERILPPTDHPVDAMAIAVVHPNVRELAIKTGSLAPEERAAILNYSPRKDRRST